MEDGPNGDGREGEEASDEGEDDESYSDDGRLLGNTLNGDALARTLVDTQVANELGLVRSEVRRLRAKIEKVEREKDDMAEDFRNTTKVLLNRIKELEGEVIDASSRPGTAGVVERIEGPSTWSRSLARPPLATPSRPGSNGGFSGTGSLGGSLGGSPQILKIVEDEPATCGETSLCGNCRRNIPAGNILAHSVSCYRNNFHCDACDEVLPLREKDGHMKEWSSPERLVDAMASRDIDTVQKMLGHNADICTAAHPNTGDTAMHAAARLGDAELVAFCTGHGVDINPANAQGETPLHLAAAGATDGESGPSPAVRLLVELGAGLNTLNLRGESALLMLCRRGIAQTAKYLVELRADTDVRTNLGDTPLQIAQRSGHQETVLALVSAGAALRPGTPSRASTPNPPPVTTSSRGGGTPEGRARSGSPTRERRKNRSSSGVRAEAAAGYPPKPRMKRSNSSRGGGGAECPPLGARSGAARPSP